MARGFVQLRIFFFNDYLEKFLFFRKQVRQNWT